MEAAHHQHIQQNQHLSQQTLNPARQREITPNSQLIAASEPPSETEDTAPSANAPSAIIEDLQPHILPLNPVTKLLPSAPNPSPVTVPDPPSSSPVH